MAQSYTQQNIEQLQNPTIGSQHQQKHRLRMETLLNWALKKRAKIGFQNQLSLHIHRTNRARDKKKRTAAPWPHVDL